MALKYCCGSKTQNVQIIGNVAWINHQYKKLSLETKNSVEDQAECREGKITADQIFVIKVMIYAWKY